MTTRLRNSSVLPAGMLALFAWLVLLPTLDPRGSGPGLTCDEYYYAAHGKRLVRRMLEQGPRFFTRANIAQNFGLMHEHPPLAVFLLGVAQAPFDRFPHRPDIVWMPGARLASATALALLIGAVASITARAAGTFAGVASGLALLFMPRAFAHAHFAALDLLTAAFMFASVATLFWATAHGATPARRIPFAGMAWGLALLCKANGFLLAPPLTLWIVVSLRSKALKPLIIWYVTGLVTFVLGWPWLWADASTRLRGYLASTTERIAIDNFYLGRAWPDFATPWHYPWVMTAVTIPVGLLALVALGLFAIRQSDESGRLAQLTVLTVVCLLASFSLPGVPVYDGARLFLLVYPLCAVLAGLGAARLLAWPWLARLGPRLSIALLIALILTQAYGIVHFHPFQLSYYNALVGGLRGAERLGFEITYWGDSVTSELMQATIDEATDTRVWFAPTLAPWQVTAQRAVFPQLEARGILLEPWSPETAPASDARWAVVYHRRSAEPTWAPLVAGADVVAENAIDGVWLARLVRLSQEQP